MHCLSLKLSSTFCHLQTCLFKAYKHLILHSLHLTSCLSVITEENMSSHRRASTTPPRLSLQLHKHTTLKKKEEANMHLFKLHAKHRAPWSGFSVEQTLFLNAEQKGSSWALVIWCLNAPFGLLHRPDVWILKVETNGSFIPTRKTPRRTNLTSD